jgi:hypothetical protein
MFLMFLLSNCRNRVNPLSLSIGSLIGTIDESIFEYGGCLFLIVSNDAIYQRSFFSFGSKFLQVDFLQQLQQSQLFMV